jgi:hypothetical protein
VAVAAVAAREAVQAVPVVEEEDREERAKEVEVREGWEARVPVRVWAGSASATRAR